MGLRETVQRIASMPHPPPNEEAAKNRVLSPILVDLGWDVEDRRHLGEVLWEHPVGPGRRAGQTGRVDIALANTGQAHRLVCLIEAKAPHEDLSKHVGQLMGYAFHEGVDICVLSALRSPKQFGAFGAWVETNLSSNDTLRKCRQLLELFGYPASDLEVLTSQ